MHLKLSAYMYQLHRLFFSKGGSQLYALGKNSEEQDSALRFSLSPFISSKDIDYTLEVIKEVAEIRKIYR